MPPTTPLPLPEGDIAPYPMDILILGGGRWLALDGQILTKKMGQPVVMQENTRVFWEASALRGTGKTVAELLAEDVA